MNEAESTLRIRLSDTSVRDQTEKRAQDRILSALLAMIAFLSVQFVGAQKIILAFVLFNRSAVFADAESAIGVVERNRLTVVKLH